MMMHSFGLPIFMGGPLTWIILFIAGYFLIRRFILPHIHEKSRGRRSVAIETDIYRLAAKRNGKITVSDVVMEFGIEARRAEKVLESMSDGRRVQMEVDDNGMVFYTFPELQRQA